MALKDFTEAVLEEAAERVASRWQALDELIGPPMGSEPEDMDSKLEKYQFGEIDEATGQYLKQPLRGNPQGCYEWMRAKVDEWTGKMTEVGLDPALAHPWDVAYTLLIRHSAEMEREIQKRAAPALMDMEGLYYAEPV